MMSLSQVEQLVSTVFQAGYMNAQIEMKLRPDKVRRKDAENYLALRGYEKQILSKWVANRLIKEYVGDYKNSPCLYSLKEINKLMTSVQIKKAII